MSDPEDEILYTATDEFSGETHLDVSWHPSTGTFYILIEEESADRNSIHLIPSQARALADALTVKLAALAEDAELPPIKENSAPAELLPATVHPGRVNHRKAATHPVAVTIAPTRHKLLPLGVDRGKPLGVDRGKPHGVPGSPEYERWLAKGQW